MPEPQAGGCSSVVLAGWAGDGGSEALGMSAGGPAAAGDPDVVAVRVVKDGEDGVLGAVVMAAQALAVVGVGRAGRPGNAVVLVGLGRWSAAAGEHAGPVAGFEEPAKPGWEAVAAGGQG